LEEGVEMVSEEKESTQKKKTRRKCEKKRGKTERRGSTSSLASKGGGVWEYEELGGDQEVQRSNPKGDA